MLAKSHYDGRTGIPHLVHEKGNHSAISVLVFPVYVTRIAKYSALSEWFKPMCHSRHAKVDIIIFKKRTN